MHPPTAPSALSRPLVAASLSAERATEHDLCAKIEKESCGRFANPAGGSSDDGHLAVKPLPVCHIAHHSLLRKIENATMRD
jgi:hypothetical protein